MRNGFTPEIDATEISDSELDNISGGLATLGGEIAGHGLVVHVGELGGGEHHGHHGHHGMHGGQLGGGLVSVNTIGL
ncbi:hypothetical protein [Streptomyces sp. CT34]|uniref:hypothetical protein n=1 Tax=Streptomyces sp. CT34 TaxID=1553907 RepID=UPI0005B8B162|nr:hypothetical protein [Streptomyces sp. CT34]